MGSVWEAESLGTARRVAIKVIKPEYAAHPDIAKRFYREARAIATLNTPHVVQVYDCAQDAETGAPYLAMEMLSGEDVSALSKRVGFVHPDLALRIAAQALLGLGAAHAAGIVHRDVKPANLFLARAGGGAVVVKVLDFGIAKDLAGETKATKLTHTGTPLGSPEYMSPEQIAGARVDHRTDIWSLGAVLYECLAQRGPYEGHETWLALANAITEGPPRSVQDFATWVPREVAAVIYGAMAWATDRYQSTDAMLEAIRRLLPHGYDINEAMLRPMAFETRQTSGEKFPVRPFAKAATNAGVTTAARGTLSSSSLGAVVALGVAALVTVPVLLWRSRAAGTTSGSAEPSTSVVREFVPPPTAPAASALTVVAPAETAAPSPTTSASVNPPVASTTKATAPPRRPIPKSAPPAAPQPPDGMIKSF